MSHVVERHESFAKAILNGTDRDVQEYLEYGANIDELDEYGFTPLIEAILAGKQEIIELFLERGCIVDLPDSAGRTPLFWAVDHNDQRLCELLLRYGANPNAYTVASQPVLVNAILRGQKRLQNFLIKHGAKLTFAQDYINSKLIGHRFELSGKTTIYDNDKAMLGLDFEGFFLEFTVSILRQSLERFINHFAGRKLKPLFPHCQEVIKSLKTSAELLQYQHHTLNLERFEKRIERLIEFRPLLIPVGYAGHAITFVLFKNVLVKIDRGHLSHEEGSVVVYQIGEPKIVNNDFIKHLYYVLQPKHFVEKTYKELLKLTPVVKLPISSQKVGNCSWANVEAVIPTMMFLTMWDQMPEANQEDLQKILKQVMYFYNKWSEWDKDIALNECIKSFESAELYRQVTKVDVLNAILFQCCDYRKSKDIDRAEKILPVITQPEFDYILKSYFDVYLNQEVSDEGNNLMHLLEICGASFDDWKLSTTGGGYGDED